MEPKTAQKCPQLLRDFLYYMEIIRGCSPKTVTGYYLDLSLFLRYVTSVRGNSAVTRARKIGSLRSFYKFICTKTTLLQKNPTLDLDVPMHRRSLPIYLSLDESKAFLQAVNDAQDSRDFCIFTLLLNCGMRLSELIGLQHERANPALTGQRQQRADHLSEPRLHKSYSGLYTYPQSVTDKSQHFIRACISPF